MKRQRFRWHLSRHARTIIFISGLAAIGAFVLVNGVLWGMYRERTYPRTKVMGSPIGSVAYSNLSEKVSSLKLLPDSLEFSHNQQKATVTLADLGVTKDVSRTAQSADKQRAWLPLLNFFRTTELQAPVAINNQKFEAKAAELANILRQEPISAHLTVTGAAVSIVEARNGYGLQKASLKQVVLRSMDNAKASIHPPVDTTRPTLQATDLQDQKADLEAQFKTALTYNYAGKSKQASAEEIASWYVPSGEIYVLSADKVQAYVMATGQGFGIRIKDINAVVVATTQALAKKQSLGMTLVQQVALKTFTYCVAAKGVDATYLPGLRAKLHDTYSNSRGWSIGGLVEFKEVSTGCNFTVWLTAASLMPTFGEICDSVWSCRVGPNVVINFDRWQHASPAWNQLGGSLDEYRHMVINHESGHWLGFGHAMCSGSGQQAPVMQQQSIDLQGCSFNAWPTAGEIAVLRRTLGL